MVGMNSKHSQLQNVAFYLPRLVEYGTGMLYMAFLPKALESALGGGGGSAAAGASSSAAIPAARISLNATSTQRCAHRGRG